MKNCTPLWREAHCQAKMYKAYQVRITFGSYDVEKVHAVVARSAFRSQHVQSTPGSDHFWKLRCRKSACRCGAKQISEPTRTKHISSRPLLEVEMSKVHAFVARSTSRSQNVQKHTRFGPLLEVEMSKKCTPLWREAHFRSQNVQSTTCLRHFWRFRCAFAWQAQGIAHVLKSEQNVRVFQHFQKQWQAWDI